MRLWSSIVLAASFVIMFSLVIFMLATPRNPETVAQLNIAIAVSAALCLGSTIWFSISPSKQVNPYSRSRRKRSEGASKETKV